MFHDVRVSRCDGYCAEQRNSGCFLHIHLQPELAGNYREARTQPIASNRLDLVTYVFQMNVKALLKGMSKIGWFAKVIGNIWTREYQK
jgi:hypothetical protein